MIAKTSNLFNRRLLNVLVSCALQKILFEYLYVTIIYPSFYYYGFQCEFSILRYVISWLLYLPVPVFTALSSRKETLSRVIIAALLNIIYTPCLILFVYMSHTPFIIWISLYFVIMAFAVNHIKTIHVNFVIGNNKRFESISWIIGFILGIIIIFVWGYYARFHIQLNFSDVYTARMIAREFSTPAVINYARAMARSVIPLMVTYSLYRNYLWRASFFILIQLIQFFIDGSKSVFFVLVIGIFAYFFLERTENIIDKIPVLMTFGAAISIIEHAVLNSTFFSNTLFRRTMFVPALLNYHYFDAAQSYGIDYYRQSISVLGQSRYASIIPRFIGRAYWGNESVNANNGLFADAYINLGVVGCFLMPILIIVIFRMIERAGNKLPEKVWTVCVVQAFFSFTSSSFFTVLITHGVILMIIMLYNLTPKVGDIDNGNIV